MKYFVGFLIILAVIGSGWYYLSTNLQKTEASDKGMSCARLNADYQKFQQKKGYKNISSYLCLSTTKCANFKATGFIYSNVTDSRLNKTKPCILPRAICCKKTPLKAPTPTPKKKIVK